MKGPLVGPDIRKGQALLSLHAEEARHRHRVDEVIRLFWPLVSSYGCHAVERLEKPFQRRSPPQVHARAELGEMRRESSPQDLVSETDLPVSLHHWRAARHEDGLALKRFSGPLWYGRRGNVADVVESGQQLGAVLEVSRPHVLHRQEGHDLHPSRSIVERALSKLQRPFRLRA